MPEHNLIGFGLSPQQIRLWLLQESEGPRPFRARCAVEIEGRLDEASLRQALGELVRRHEILRTRFEAPAAMSLPLQVVMETPDVSFSRHDLSGLDEAGVRAELDLLWSATAAPEELSAGLALRAMLAVLSSERRRLFLVLPALCCDAVGLDNLVAELAAELRFRAGLGQPPPEEPLQYADLAAWQNDVFKSPNSQAGREFWRQQPPASEPPSLPVFADGGSADGFFPARLDLAIAPHQVTAVEALAARWAVPGSLVWLGCWQALVAQLCGEQEMLGVVLAGRHYADLEQVPGLFARCAPLRSSPDLGSDMRRLVSDLRATLAEMEKWQECFGWDEAGPQASKDRQSYHSVCFEEQPPLPVFSAGEVTFSVLSREAHFDRFDLELVVGGAGPRLFYDAAAIPEDAVHRIGDQLTALVESLVRDPEARIADLAMVGAAERRDMARLDRSGCEPRRQEATLVRRFEEQATRRGAETAVVTESGALTYAELNIRANRLARYLIRFGVVPESRVALLLDRSAELAVALLGVLTAGGAYVPLDPAQPRERLARMIEEISPKLVLTLTREWREPITTAAPVVVLDGADAEEIARERGDSPRVVTVPQNLAYVLFTSGSTGTPKGVAVEQRQVLNYLDAVVPWLRCEAGLHYAMVSTFAADLGNTVLFPSLATGGCLHIVDQERAGNPEALAEYFDRHTIDVLKIVPSHFQALLAVSRPERVVPRRCLVLGGEACSWDLVDRVRALRPECRVLNHYGPTETTVGVLISELAEDRRGRHRRGPWESAPIGRPIADTRVHLVDRHLRPVPWGARGELFVGGPNVTRGYLGRPAATAERFVPDPFSGVPGERLYRTGDLTRLTPAAEVVFVGRADQQVKLRGFRIELGEVEAALRRHPRLHQAVVTARDDGPGGRRLVAYFVSSDELPDDELRAWVRERLPEYMAPAAYVRLDALPVNANGKVDRRSLPAPEEVRSARVYVPPRGPIEVTLAAIWSEILAVDRVGSGDNFFDLGGDSILAIQIVARASREGIRLVPRQIFEQQTLAELARVASTAEVRKADPGIVTGPVPLIPIQHAFFERELRDAHHYNQFLFLESPERLWMPWIEAAIRELLSHHDALRLRYHRSGSHWQQTSGGEIEPAVALLDLGALPAARREAALEAAAARVQASLDLTQGPLFRAVLFRPGTEPPDHLLLVAHHLVVDGVSWRVLLEDFQTVYDQLGQGLGPDLPPKTSSFKEWAEHLTVSARSDELRQELDHWIDDALPAGGSLPVDDAGGDNRQGSACAAAVAFEVDETRALLQDVPRVYGTQINDALLVALAKSFEAWAGSATLRIDLEGHGREEEIAPDLDLTRTVGWFTSVFPVVLDVRGAASMGAALKKVKEQLRAIPHRGIGYGMLRYLADPEIAARLAGVPRAEVSFNYLGQLDQVVSPTSSLRFAALSAGPASSPRNDRPYLLQIVAQVEGGQLLVSWKYGSEIHRHATIERVAEAFRSALQSLIRDSATAEATRYTPSDFPEAQLNQEQLDELLKQLGGPTE